VSHPSSCKDPECVLTYAQHLTGIAFTSDAMPTRHPEAHQTNIREKRWQRDIPAFRRLVKDGHRPRTIDGSRFRELHAESPHDIEHRPVTIDYSDPK
jgi:hypothetical protein